MAIPINHLNDAVIYLEGRDYVGHASNVEIEGIEFNKTEEERLGMIGTPKLFTSFDPITMTVTWVSLRDDWSKLFANPLEAFNLQILGNISVHGPTGLVEDQPYVVTATVMSDQHHLGSVTQKETTEFETTMNCNYLKQNINGVDILEYDIYNYIVMVDGRDLVENRRANLGF